MARALQVAAVIGSIVLLGVGFLAAQASQVFGASPAPREPLALVAALVFAAYVACAWSGRRSGPVAVVSDGLAALIQVLAAVVIFQSARLLAADAHAIGPRCGMPGLAASFNLLLAIACLLAVVALQAHLWLQKRIAATRA